jgi:hypothetical protein
LQVALVACLAQHTLKAGTKLLLNQSAELGSMRFATPVQAVERVQVHAGRDIFDADALEQWFLENTSNLRGAAREYAWEHKETSSDPESHIVTVRFWFP